MRRHDFFYDLPEERIAQIPVEPRDSSRLLVLDRKNHSLSHHVFHELGAFLQPGDVLVRNVTKVLPVRLFGKKLTGGSIEVLLTKRLLQTPHYEEWESLTRPGLKPGQVVHVGTEDTYLEVTFVGDEGYSRRVRVTPHGDDLIPLLSRFGELPTPPYIREHLADQNRYQTVYAQNVGSAAAPTAGLHFTPSLLSSLEEKGVIFADVTLHVGLGTFLPVKADDVEDHHMHSEWYEIPASTAEKINLAKSQGKRVIAIGTTSMRALEAAGAHQNVPHSPLQSEARETDIFITPPYSFRVCDGIITNFHLPESTLLMLISAFMTSPQSSEVFTNFPNSFLGKAYQEAIAEKYRFFSFGDAMLIL